MSSEAVVESKGAMCVGWGRTGPTRHGLRLTPPPSPLPLPTPYTDPWIKLTFSGAESGPCNL